MPIADKLTKFLVGAEHLTPEIRASLNKVVSETGHINEKALGGRRLLGDLLIGKKGVGSALKARYHQGGLLGRGGLVRGELALDPRYTKLLKRLKASKGAPTLVDPYTGKAISRTKALGMAATKGVGQSMNPLFLLGFPLMDMKSSLEAPSYTEEGGMSGTLKALGGGLGFAAAGPLGLLGGMGTSVIGGHLGATLGKAFDPDAPLMGFRGSASNKLPKASDIILDAAVPK